MYKREEHRVSTHQQSTTNKQPLITILSTAKHYYPINLDLSISYMTLTDN